MKSEEEIITRYFGNNVFQSVNHLLRYVSFLPPLFFKYFKNKIDIFDYSKHNILDEETIVNNITKVDLTYSLSNKKYNIDFLDILFNRLSLTEVLRLCMFQDLDMNFIDKYKYSLHWASISKRQKLSLDFIKKNEKLICFDNFIFNKNLTNEIYSEYKNKIDLNHFLLNNFYDYDKDLILNNLSRLSNFTFSYCLDFDDEFFNKHKDKIDWNALFTMPKTKISEKFILDNINKINFSTFNNYHLLSDETLIKIQNQINYSILSRTKNLSDKVIDTLKDNLNWQMFAQHIKLPYEKLVKYKRYLINYSLQYFSNKNGNFKFILETYKYTDLSICSVIPEDYVRFNYSNLALSTVLSRNQYSVDFLRRMQNILPIYYVVKCQKIPTEFANYLEMNALK